VGIAAARVLGGFKRGPRRPARADALDERRSGGEQASCSARAGALQNVKDGILPLLQDRSWEVRRRAVQALAATGEPGVAELLVPLCQESEVAVRCAAIEGLVQLKYGSSCSRRREPTCPTIRGRCGDRDAPRWPRGATRIPSDR
jgi:HEAT repeat protein